jgi:hypothetical protein
MYRSPPKADWRTDGWMKEEEEKDGEGDFVLWKSQDLGESTPKVCSSAPLAHTAPLFGSAFPDHDVGSIPSTSSSSLCPSTLPATVSRLPLSPLVLFTSHMAEEERATFPILAVLAGQHTASIPAWCMRPGGKCLVLSCSIRHMLGNAVLPLRALFSKL